MCIHPGSISIAVPDVWYAVNQRKNSSDFPKRGNIQVDSGLQLWQIAPGRPRAEQTAAARSRVDEIIAPPAKVFTHNSEAMKEIAAFCGITQPGSLILIGR